MHDQELAGQGMHVVDGMLVAQVPDGIEDEALHRFKAGLMARVHATAPRGVVIDMSRVRLLDSVSFEIIVAAGRMAAMLGARVVYAGFQPGVVSALMDLGVDTGGLTTVLGLSEALEMLQSARRRAPEEDREEDPEGDMADGPDAATEATPSGGEHTP